MGTNEVVHFPEFPANPFRLAGATQREPTPEHYWPSTQYITPSSEEYAFRGIWCENDDALIIEWGAEMWPAMLSWSRKKHDTEADWSQRLNGLIGRGQRGDHALYLPGNLSASITRFDQWQLPEYIAVPDFGPVPTEMVIAELQDIGGLQQRMRAISHSEDAEREMPVVDRPDTNVVEFRPTRGIRHLLIIAGLNSDELITRSIDNLAGLQYAQQDLLWKGRESERRIALVMDFLGFAATWTAIRPRNSRTAE